MIMENIYYKNKWNLCSKIRGYTQKLAIEFFIDILATVGCSQPLNDDWYNIEEENSEIS